jgi:hypothetical protein
MVVSLPTDQLKTLSMRLLRETMKQIVAPWLNSGKGWIEGQDIDSELYDIVLMDPGAEEVIESLPYTDAEGNTDFPVNLVDKATEWSRRRLGKAGFSFALQWKVPPEDKLLLETKQLLAPPHIREQQANARKKDGIDLADCLSAFSKEETLRKTDAW